METKGKKILAEPEFLSRNDTEGGRWTVDECRAVRGEPSTDIVNREMKVPTQDDDLARCIRAHEMMHAKVSPAGEWKEWIDRKIASRDAMVATEELRVNLLCQKAGFDVKGNLTDGGEMADGERVAATKDWKGAVQFTIATAGTASNKAFLTGIRRHNREWGIILLDISKRAVKEMEKAYKTKTLASTMKNNHGLAPYGFSHTERIAEWVDRLSETSPEDIQRQKEEARRAREEARRNKQEGAKSPEEGKEGTHSNEGEVTKDAKGKDDGNPFKGITPDKSTGRIPTWGELNIRVLPMPIHSKGNIGKKRIASNYGMRPRRIHRYMTDPQMRIFDRTVKGTGGVVIIDASGSMSFSREQLTKILENAPGATVAVYTDAGTDVPNLWVVAQKGKMVDKLPETGFGNGVDFPAIEWGHKQKQSSNSPMIWVTDGGVCGPNQHYSNMLAMQCINFCRKNNIVVVPHVGEAIEQLHKLKNGEKAKSVWPAMFKQAYKEKMGHKLEA
jgi:hypothetical protein